MATRTTIRIRRTGGRYDEFALEAGIYTTILDALEEIVAKTDATLLYRHSCHHGSCGTCSVIANGARVLACTTRLTDLGEEVTLEPLSPFPVVGDLAIDPTPLFDGFPRDSGYLRPSEVNHDSPVPSEIERFSRFENCIECGLCVSACPVRADFMGPAALAAYSREIDKRPEREAELLAQVDSQRGVWGCERALECSRTCPLGVYPAKHIAVLQRKIRP
ncbi:MAG: succinate dehydrogenase/fumarate reductase iron-sulfur subunit [Spirochaetota bacterium]